MYFVFNCISNNTQKYLYYQYKRDISNSFLLTQKIINYLRIIYQNPYQTHKIQKKYQEFRIENNQTFYKFKTEFLYLADEAEISASEYFNNMYNKLTITLQIQLASQHHTFS